MTKIFFTAFLCFVLIFTLVKTVEKGESPNLSVNEGNPDDLLKMDQKEKDKILTCVEIISIVIRNDAKIIEDTGVMLGNKVNAEVVQQKITGDMLNKCYFSIDETTVATVFYNGQFQEPEFNASLLDFAAVDYSSYKLLSPQEFQITPETQLLFMKIEQARNDYISNSKQRIESGKGEFKIFGYSIRDVPLGLNLLLSIIILSLFFGTILFFLKKLQKSEKEKKAAGRKLEKNQKNN